MSDTLVLVLVIVGAVIVIVLVAWIYVRVRARRRVTAMSPEERELFEAQRQYDDAVEKAAKTLDITERIWEKRVKAAENAVTEANSIGTRAIGSYRKVKVFEDHVETPSGAFHFENGPVEATVDTAPNLVASKQAALSRAGQEVMRRLTNSSEKPEQAQTPYLLVETPVFVDATEGKTDDAAQLRQFALSMNNASGSVHAIQEQRAQNVAAAEGALTSSRAEAERAIAAARQESETVKANSLRLDTAKAALEKVRQAADLNRAPDQMQSPPTQTANSPTPGAGAPGETPAPGQAEVGGSAGTPSLDEGVSSPRDD